MIPRSRQMHRQAALSAKPLVSKFRTPQMVSAIAATRDNVSTMVQKLDGPADVTSFVEDLNVKYEKVIDPFPGNRSLKTPHCMPDAVNSSYQDLYSLAIDSLALSSAPIVIC